MGGGLILGGRFCAFGAVDSAIESNVRNRCGAANRRRFLFRLEHAVHRDIEAMERVVAPRGEGRGVPLALTFFAAVPRMVATVDGTTRGV